MENEMFAAFAARAGGGCDVAVVGAAKCGKTSLIEAFAGQSGAALQSGERALATVRPEGGAHFSLCEGDASAYAAAVLLVADGSFGEGHEAGEERECAARLRASGRPFVIVVNTARPDSAECLALAQGLSETYGVPAYPCNCAGNGDLSEALGGLLLSFPPLAMEIEIPAWMSVLPAESETVAPILQKVREAAPSVRRLSDCARLQEAFAEGDVYCESCETDPASGRAVLRLAAREGVFYRMMSRECGEDVSDDLHLMAYVASLKEAKRFYEKFRGAFAAAETNGYGVVGPAAEDMALQAPELFRKNGRCGVRLKADAPSYHVLKIDVHSELTPVTGEAARSEEIARGMIESYEKDAEALWNTDMFGRTFKEMALSGLCEKLTNMPDEARSKLRRAVMRIVNEGKGGVICILL